MINTWIGIAAFLVSVFASRIVNERALKNLAEDEAARLVKGFSSYRIYSLAGAIAILAGYFAALKYYPSQTTEVFIGFIGAFVVFMLVNTFVIFRKLRALEMPDDYINRFLLVTLIKYGGVFVLFGTVLSNR